MVNLHIRGTGRKKLLSLSWREVLPGHLERKARDTRRAIPGALPGPLAEGRQVAWFQPVASPPGFIAWLKIQRVLLAVRGMAWTPTLRSPDLAFSFRHLNSFLGSSQGHPRLSGAYPLCAEYEAL